MRDDYYTAANDSFADFEQEDRPQGGISLASVLRLLRGRWHWAIMLGLLLAIGGGYAGYHLEPPKYTALSEVTIRPNYASIAVEVTDLSVYEPYWNVVSEEVERLEDVATAELAMQQPDWQEAVSSTAGEFASMTPVDFVKSIELIPPFKNEQDIKVNFITEDPLISQAGLNALLDAYSLLQKEGTDENIDESLTLLQNRKRDLELYERQIREQMRLIIPDSEQLKINRRLATKLAEQANMEFKLSELDLIIGPFLDPNNQQSKLSIKELMQQDPEMIELLKEKERLEDEYVYLTEIAGYGETMAIVVQNQRLLSRVDRQILDLEAGWLEGGDDTTAAMPPQVVELLARHKALVSKVAELEAETNDIAARIAAVEEDQLELAQTRETIRSVKEQIRKFEETDELRDENEQVTRILVGEKAPFNPTPSNAKNRIQFAGAGGVGGLVVGFGLVMLIGLMDRRLRHVSDTASELPDANVLGILPTLPADLTDPEQAETAAHCVHHIRTLLQIGGTNRVFSITSPAAGSGKSSLATALGMSFAATGSRTLIIDSDLVGAGISRRMGSIVHESLETVIRKKGMMDEAELARAQTLAASRGEALEQVLEQEKLLSEEQLNTAKRLQLDTSLGLLDACVPGRLRSCVAASGTEHFFVLPVGKARPSDASRLSPAAMRELVRQAREAFDIVLIDTGPVLGSLEASIAAAESDATVMIVSRGDHRTVASRSLEQLRSVRANIAGLVFNHALDSDLAHTSYASLVSQERRPDLSVRKRKLDKTRSARLGPLGTAVASCTEEMSEDDSLMVSPNGSSNGHG